MFLRRQWGRSAPYFWSTSEVPPHFVYPPHWVVIALPAALLPFPVATGMRNLVNHLSLVGICILCWRLSLQREPTTSKPLLLAAIAVCTASPGTCRPHGLGRSLVVRRGSAPSALSAVFGIAFVAALALWRPLAEPRPCAIHCGVSRS
jgi:hypothetical protein